MSQAAQPLQAGPSRWVGRVVSGMVGVLLAGGLLSPQSPLNARLCGAIENYPGVAELICEPGSLRISDRAAADFVDGWTLRLGGSRREVATWRYLSRGAEFREPPSDYVSRWRPVVYAARTSPVARVGGELNVFTVTVQVLYFVDAVDQPNPPFSVDRLGVDDLVVKFDMSLDQKHRVTSRLPQIVDRQARSGFMPRVLIEASVDTDYFDSPTREPDGDLNIQAGARERAVCEFYLPESGWWTYTHLGWVPNEDLVTGDERVAGLIDCPSLTVE